MVMSDEEEREANLDPRKVSICVLPNPEEQRKEDTGKKGKKSVRKRYPIIHRVRRNRSLLRMGGFA
jgi:hypothetical protein